MKLVWLITGFAALGLGALGVLLPLLPTVPFLLLAAFCFARSSERFHLWLTTHPVFGPPIEDWRRSGAIRPAGKRAATISIIAAFLISVFLELPPWVLGVQAVVLSCVLIFIWSRPGK